MRRALVIALAIVAVAFVLKTTVWPGGQNSAATSQPSRPTSDSKPEASAELLAGRWTAQVTYDWGARHDESFAFVVDPADPADVRGTQIHGTASYLRLPRTIEDGRLLGDRLSFVTRSDEALGDGPTRAVTHRYRGILKSGELQLTLESSGGHSQHTPVDFVARRNDQ